MDDRIIRTKLETLRRSLAEPLGELGPWEGRRAKQIEPGEYEYATDWAASETPSRWPALSTAFLRTTYKPVEAPAEFGVFLEFDMDSFEGMASLDGVAYCGVDWSHPRVVAPQKPGELLIEGMAVPSAFQTPADAAREATFRGVRLVRIHRAEQGALTDLEYAHMTSHALEPGRRKSLVDAALEDAMLVIDLTRSRDEVRRSTIEAGAVLRSGLDAIGRDPEGGELFYAGHTHIDTAWLWPIRETVRKCGRTFSTACRLMEQYPSFHFSCSQAQLYDYTKKYYPGLYEQIKGWVKEGRWHTTGGMWVETDCNVTSGESLIRQFLYGIEFFKRELGTRPRSCWLPDVFGYPASLPQILKGCGIPYFFTYKLHWQARNRFPDHLFQWEGIDGSRVLGHIPLLLGAYNGNPTPDQLVFAWKNFDQKDTYPELLFPYGWGDGGGGATMEMIEYMERASDYPGLPKGRTGGEEQFFDDAAASGQVTDTWVGELYLETHRGTYTTHTDAKQGNRRCELALRDAEILGTFASWAGAPADLSELKKAWELTLVNQFHDILPGSSITVVYEDMRRDYETILSTVAKTTDAACRGIASVADADAVTVINTTNWERTDPAGVQVANANGSTRIVTSDGEERPTQLVELCDDTTQVVFSPLPVEGMSAASYKVGSSGAGQASPFTVDARRIESPVYVIELGDDGSVTRLFDKRADREVVPEGERLNELQFYQDGPEGEAAWNIHATYAKKRYDASADVKFETLCDGPVCAGVRVTRSFRDSVFVQDIVVYESTPRIDFVTKADWQERQTMVKVAFPVAVRARWSTAEVQFGAIERATHRNTSWEQEKFEVCGQRWVDLSEPGYGVSLLNTGRYGFDFQSGRIGLTLLRGTEAPDPVADLGEQKVTYSLLPHIGDWVEAGTVFKAAELNIPLRAVPGAAPASTGPRLSTSGLPVVIETLKPAEDGRGCILRLYEPHGARGKVSLTLPENVKSVMATNLVEEDEGNVAVESGRVELSVTPFQIRTLRLLD